MYEVTCFRCLRIVHITPDDERCSVCGEDLKQLIPAAYASRYFYDRAAHFAGEGKLQGALAEVKRGLAYRESSELHLLGGILAKRLHDFDLMRQHVAAIPLDDVLRQEAEWLLRSHQTHQRTLRQADKARKNSRQLDSFEPEEEPLPFMVEDVSPSPAHTLSPTSPPMRLSRIGGGLLVVLILIAAGWSILGRGAASLGGWLPSGGTPTEQPETAGNVAPAATDAATLKFITDTQPSLILTPTLIISITPDVPNNLVQTSGTPEPLAATTPRSAVEAVDSKLFDLKSFLLQKEREDLAQLEVSAILQGPKLKLKGIVPMDAQRRALIDLAQGAPDVTTVDAVDLFVRLPLTYTVQEGDTLWDITVKLYGDPARMSPLIQANTDVLASPEALRVGMVLKIPSNQ